MIAKQEVLGLLKEEQLGFVSGEAICQRLQVSRTAVWKIVESLRREGYDIEARPRAGYRLLASPDILEPSEWAGGLQTGCIGQRAHYLKSTASTNDVAKELARGGAPEGTVVVTEEQTKGRGRLGRSWFSHPRASLCFSVILYPRVNPMEVAQFTMLAAVAVVRAIQKQLGLAAAVKWPNDVYVSGLKVCGILAEMTAETDRVKYLVLGIGLNVNQSKENLGDLSQMATSLKVQTGQQVSRAKLLTALLEELDELYGLWQARGFSSLKNLWKQQALWLGCQVQMQGLNQSWEGVLEDLDDNGALILKLPSGERKTFYSGEVSLRKK